MAEHDWDYLDAINSEDKNLDGTDQWSFFEGQCTSYVAYKVDKQYPDFDNHLGKYYVQNNYPYADKDRFSHAEHWDDHASHIPQMTVENQPQEGGIAQWDPYGSDGVYGAGHVAYVEGVNIGDGTVSLSEYNAKRHEEYNERTIDINDINNFIYPSSEVPGDGFSGALEVDGSTQGGWTKDWIGGQEGGDYEEGTDDNVDMFQVKNVSDTGSLVLDIDFRMDPGFDFENNNPDDFNVKLFNGASYGDHVELDSYEGFSDKQVDSKYAWSGSQVDFSKDLYLEISIEDGPDSFPYKIDAYTDVEPPSNQKPVIETSDIEVSADESVDVQQALDDVSDPDGDAITRYKFVDTDDSGAAFTLSGQEQEATKPFSVDRDNLDEVAITGGAAGDTDEMIVVAYDGKDGKSAHFKVNTKEESRDPAQTVDWGVDMEGWANYDIEVGEEISIEDIIENYSGVNADNFFVLEKVGTGSAELINDSGQVEEKDVAGDNYNVALSNKEGLDNVKMEGESVGQNQIVILGGSSIDNCGALVTTIDVG